MTNASSDSLGRAGRVGDRRRHLSDRPFALKHSGRRAGLCVQRTGPQAVCYERRKAPLGLPRIGRSASCSAAVREKGWPCDEEDLPRTRNDFRPADVFHTLPSRKPHTGCAHGPATGPEHQKGGETMKRRSFLAGIGATTAAAAIGIPSIVRAQSPITLNGAVQFNDDHAFNRALLRFEELVKKYYGKPVNFTLHRNSSLGLEKQYFEYMSQGKAVDYGIVSPAHMSTFAKAAPFIDAPFVFKGIEHMNKVVEANILAPIADEVAAKAEVVLIGYSGGG